MIVSNSSPIITLGRVGKLLLLKHIFGTVLIPDSVYKEISLKKDTAEALALNKAINENWILVKKVQAAEIFGTKKIGEGEKEALSLAMMKTLALLIDDNLAKSYARMAGVEVHGTLYVLLIAMRKKLISKDELMDVIANMIKNGFYISSEVYAEVIKELQN